jgi:hypothetical protein
VEDDGAAGTGMVDELDAESAFGDRQETSCVQLVDCSFDPGVLRHSGTRRMAGVRWIVA